MQHDQTTILATTTTTPTPSTPPKIQEEEEDIGIILGSPTKVTTSTAAAVDEDQSPANNNNKSTTTTPPLFHHHQDETNTCILFERSTHHSTNLTPSGLHFIANHQYRPSDYTHLDNLLNPLWTYLTECLPLWLAPNMVTTFGGLHCALAYGVLWYYSPDFENDCPDWAVMFAGYCTWAYYTLDCMDGKQARRTGSSSPLGQLL